MKLSSSHFFRAHIHSARQCHGRSEGKGREELKTLLNWMMPLFNSKERRDKVNP